MTELNQIQLDKIAKVKAMAAKAPRQCEHIKTNGEFCGSPALRGRHYCFFHLTLGRRIRAERAHEAAMQKALPPSQPAHEIPQPLMVPLELPPLEDANSIQIALMQVIDAILQNRLDNKRAGLVLYALQTASSNLARGADFEQNMGTTVAAGYDDFEKDYQFDGDAPELKADDAGQEEHECAEFHDLEERAAEVVQREKEEEEAYLRMTPEERERADHDPANTHYPACAGIDRFLCGIIGPLAHARAGGAEAPKKIEREAHSQRVEWRRPPSLAEGGDEEAQAA